MADPRERLSAIGRELRLIAQMRPGLKRHAKLVGALIEAGQLQQGIEDAGRSCDDLRSFVHRLAAVVVSSSDSDFSNLGDLPEVPQDPLPKEVELRLPEGFAFYAVCPEAYVVAARKLRLAGSPRVIGIRSIGTTLGAIVAAALNAPPAITVRPFGDPFARKVELPPHIVDDRAHYVIVDEGPGLSGSSFGSVADWLQERGTPSERIAFLPSHSGDLGPQASEAHRERWKLAQRIPAELDRSFLARLFGPIEEFAGGGSWQRMKFIGQRNGSRLLLKFAGLGSIGERKLEMARSLHVAGFTAEPLALVHGFLVERWYGEARSVHRDEKPIDEIGRYVGARARLFPAPEQSGASIDELLTMCRRNISLALGKGGAATIADCGVEALAKKVRRVRTDNKLDRQEWLRLQGGRLLKCDALDHHRAHDLIGCQSVEWDVAGAIEEFGLSSRESLRLVRTTNVAVDPDLLEFYRLAYAAFRIGQAELCGDVVARERYAVSLDHLLHEGTCGREVAEILA